MRTAKLPLALATVMCMSVLQGCQSTSQVKPTEASKPIAESDPAMLQLVSIAQNIHARTAINDQILTERYGIKEEQRIPIENLPSDIKRITSYPGGAQLPLEIALKDLAHKGGLSYIHPQGKKPLSGIYVIFDGQLRTIAEFIADAGRQAGFRADVVLNVTASPKPSVQIIYKDAVL